MYTSIRCAASVITNCCKIITKSIIFKTKHKNRSLKIVKLRERKNIFKYKFSAYRYTSVRTDRASPLPSPVCDLVSIPYLGPVGSSACRFLPSSGTRPAAA